MKTTGPGKREDPPPIQFSQRLLLRFKKTSMAILGVLSWPCILGVFLVMMLIFSGEKDEDHSEVETAPEEHSPSRAIRVLKSIIAKPLRSRFFKRDSAWIPLTTTMLGLLQIFWLMNEQRPTGSGSEFDSSCPTDGRRTQTGAFVKLLAATVTTICVHGHLGSLTGSESVRRELFRAIEVLISPLTPAFTLAVMIWVELSQISPYTDGPWETTVGTRFKLARICCVRIEADGPGASSTAPRPHLAGVNPTHLEPVYLRKNLKWCGRALMLVILLAQYAQAALLLSRRIVLSRFASIDIAMLLMVISGIIGLIQSLTLTIVNTEWKIKDDDLEPCVVKECSLPKCVVFKQQSKLPNTFKFIPFGLMDLSGVPRTILHMAAAGFVQMEIVFQSARRSLKDVILILLGIKCTMYIIVTVLVSMDVARNATKDDPTDLKPDTTTTATSHLSNDQDNDTEPSVSSLPAPVTASSEKDSSSSILFTALFGVVSFSIGIMAIAAVLISIVIQSWYLIGPFVLVHLWSADQTRKWSRWDVNIPCPQLWKDGLEDELWWF
ncbi:hypothetical protein ACN47E_004506 [Coniothyrium glycines]